MLPRDSIPQPDASGFDFRALAEVISAAPGERPPPASGTALRYVGDYLLEQEIARGGMGVVYRARQLTLDRVVAVKVLRDSALAGGTEVERFRREASAAAALHHRNIIGIHEIGDHEGMCFFSMDYVPGPTLGELVKDSPLPARKAAALMVKIASAIQHAHAAGVLHRDIKPSNVIMDAAGEPVVMDFGLARHDAAALDLTFSGQVLGTPAYMAPEVAQGKSRMAGAASDVYGLGALLYQMLTARPPFAGESHLAVLQQVLNDEPVSSSLLNPALPGDLVNICAKAMSRDAARRYDSAGALEADLQSDWQSPVGRFHGATARTGAPVISPDGGMAALPAGISATGQDDAMILRDLAARKCVERLYAAPLAWSPDGAWLLSIRSTAVLAIHVATLTEHVLCNLPTPPAAWLPRVSPDWKWLVWTADGEFVTITEIASGRELPAVSAPEGAPAFSPDGTRVTIPREAGTLLISPATGKTADNSLPGATLAAWSLDGTLLALCRGTGVSVHDAATGKQRHEFSGHRGLVCSLAWAPDGQTLAVGCEDSTIHFWNLATGRDAFTLPFHTRPFLMAFARDGSSLIAGGTRGYRVLETALRLPVAESPALALALPDPAAGKPAARPAPAPEPASDRNVINQRLLHLWEAAQIYRQQRGAWPDHLSALRDLLPEPLDRALLHPEAERTGRFFWQDDYTDPAYPSPFHYDWCTVLCSAVNGYKDLSWKTDGPVTQHEYSEHARNLYGDKVPFIRCFVMHEEGELPAILYDGTLALLPDDWEKAYKTGWRPAPQKP